MPAHRKYDSIIRALHEEWALKNGYRPQASSYKRAQTTVESHKRQASSDKRQATSGKRQAKRQATSVERGPNHCV